MTHTLLLADDSVTIQRVIELTFADEDVQVVAVSDGDQAIQRLESSPPDIVLADIGMPGRNGYEVARYIRQTPKLAHIPVVLLTGAFEPVDQAKAAEVGCDGVLAKPFEPQLVIGRVKELLATPTRRSLDAGLAPPAAPAADGWAPPLADQTFAQSPPLTEPATNLDDYFDRLDSAFANLSGNPTSPAATQVAEAPVPAPPVAAPAPLDEAMDWLKPPVKQAAVETPAPTPAPVVVPVSYASPPPAFEPPVAAPQPPVAAPQPPAATFAAPAAPAYVPTMADAFAAILEAEQRDAGPSARPVWPSSSVAPSAPALEVTDDLVDRIAQRVLAQLSDRLVREQVGEIAERLIKDEIERIKASIN